MGEEFNLEPPVEDLPIWVPGRPALSWEVEEESSRLIELGDKVRSPVVKAASWSGDFLAHHRSGDPMPQVEERQASGLLLALLCAVCLLEGGNEMLMPATACALIEDLGIGLKDIGTLSLAQGLMQALCAPVWGIAAGRGVLTRPYMLSFGCVGWGFATLAMGLVSSGSLGMLVTLRAGNGVMLACLTPICLGIVADTTSEGRRGRVFGYTMLALNIGKMGVAFLATVLSHQTILGIRGWRVAFGFIGFLSIALGAVVALKMEEPAVEHAPSSGESSSFSSAQGGCRRGAAGLAAEAQRLGGYFTMPTFCVITFQGIFGSIPSNALGFDTMYFQVAGLGDARASILSAARLGMCAVGSVLGGRIGDRLAISLPRQGRALTAQISVVSGIPIVIVVFAVVPPSPDAFPLYLVLVMILGLTSSWCAAGVNYPVLSEIVPADSRSVIVAWNRALEGSSAALFGARLVSLLAASVFGYDIARGCSPKEPDAENARALGQALATATAAPWAVCFLVYSVLYWSYPRDLRLLASKTG